MLCRRAKTCRWRGTRLHTVSLVYYRCLRYAYLHLFVQTSLKKRRAQSELAVCKTLAITKTRETRPEPTPFISPTDAIRPMATRTQRCETDAHGER